jgi:hypothetical protein
MSDKNYSRYIAGTQLYLMRKNNGVTEVLLQQRKGGIFDKK